MSIYFCHVSVQVEELRFNVSTSLRFAKILTKISKAECLAIRSLASPRLNVEEEESIVSYVSALFTSIPTTDAVSVVRECLEKDSTLKQCTRLHVDQSVDLVSLCLNSTNFTNSDHFFRQQHGCALGYPISPTVTNVYTE